MKKYIINKFLTVALFVGLMCSTAEARDYTQKYWGISVSGGSYGSNGTVFGSGWISSGGYGGGCGGGYAGTTIITQAPYRVWVAPRREIYRLTDGTVIIQDYPGYFTTR